MVRSIFKNKQMIKKYTGWRVDGRTSKTRKKILIFTTTKGLYAFFLVVACVSKSGQNFVRVYALYRIIHTPHSYLYIQEITP